MLKALLLLAIFTTTIHAGHGVITVLEAPIHIKPRLNTRVIQYQRKGDKIYVPEKYFRSGEINALLPFETFDNNVEETGILSFIEVLTRSGGKGYILKDHVKLIYEDTREFSQNISPYKKDPTDYRLQEPLPDNFPFQKRRKYRAGVAFTWGPQLSNNYSYNTTVTDQELSSRKGIQMYYLRRANWDKSDQFYFGGVFTWWTSTSRFSLDGQRSAKETLNQLSFGPMVTYDLWRTQDYSLSAESSLLISYTSQNISQFDRPSQLSEDRLFTGLTVMPKLAGHFSFKNVVQDLDFVLGVESQFFLPHKLSSGSQANSSLWNNTEEDQVIVPFNVYWNAFLGLRGRY